MDPKLRAPVLCSVIPLALNLVLFLVCLKSGEFAFLWLLLWGLVFLAGLLSA